MTFEVSVDSGATCGSSEYISSEARSEAATRYQLALMRKRSARLPYLLRPLGQPKVKLAVDRPIEVTPSPPGPFLTTAQREKLYNSINAEQPKKKNSVVRPKKVKSLVKLSPVIASEAVTVLGSLVTLAASPPMAVVQQVLRALDDQKTSPAMLETLALVLGARLLEGLHRRGDASRGAEGPCRNRRPRTQRFAARIHQTPGFHGERVATAYGFLSSYGVPGG